MTKKGGKTEMTIKQINDAIEEMRKIYPFDDDEVEINSHEINRSTVDIKITDEKSGIEIRLRKYIETNSEDN